jgi:hypothetical protein
MYMRTIISKNMLTMALVGALLFFISAFPETTQSAQLAHGTLVKSANSPAVYVVGENSNTLHPFPHANVYSSWGYPANFSTVEQISPAVFSSYIVGEPVAFRDGSLVRSLTNPAVYYIESQTRKPIRSAEVFLGLGFKWEDITWLTDSFLSEYPIADPLTSITKHLNGTLIKYPDTGTIFLIDNGNKRGFRSQQALSSNRYRTSQAITIPRANTYPDGAPIEGFESRLSIARPIKPAQVPSPTPTPTPTPTPQEGLIISTSSAIAIPSEVVADPNSGGQSLIPFISATFSAQIKNAKVTRLEYERFGISSDAQFDEFYLFVGDARLPVSGFINNKKVVFNDPAGLFTILANTSATVTLRGNIEASAQSGSTFGFRIATTSSISVEALNLKGVFPITAPSMRVVRVSDLGRMSIGAEQVPVATAAGETSALLWRGVFKSFNQPMRLERLLATVNGSVRTGDFVDFGIFEGGTKRASGTMNQEKQIIFELQSSPIKFSSGSQKTLEIRANIVRGAGRTYKLSIEEKPHIRIVDETYDAFITPYPANLAPGQFSPITSPGTSTISTGELLVTRSTVSPSGTIAQNANAVLLGRWDIRAIGEDMRMRSMDAFVTTSTGGGLRNVQFYADGIAIGSQQNLQEGVKSLFNFGSNVVVKSGSSLVVELRGDVRNAAGSQFPTNATVRIGIGSGGRANIEQQISKGTLSRPSSDNIANTLTVEAGTFGISKNVSLPDITMAAGSESVRLGSAIMTAGSTEGVSVNSIVVQLSTQDAGKVSNLHIRKNGIPVGTTKSNPVALNSFFVNFTLAPLEIATLDVYADVLLGSSTGTWVSQISGQGTSSSSGSSIQSGTVSLQAITLGTGTLVFNRAAQSPSADILVAGELKREVNAVRFSAQYEDFMVEELSLATTANFAPHIKKVYLEYPTINGRVTAEQFVVDSKAVFSNLKLYVPRDGDATTRILIDVNTIVNAQTTGTQGSINLEASNSFRALGLSSREIDRSAIDSSGSVRGQSIIFGRTMVIRKSKPEVELVSLTDTVLDLGTKTVNSFKVRAKGTTSSIGLYKISWNFSTGGSGISVTNPKLFDSTSPNSQLPGSFSITPDTGSGGSMEFTFTESERIEANSNANYLLKATISGSITKGSAVLFRLAEPSDDTYSGTAVSVASLERSIVWSDVSAGINHSLSSTDWSGSKYIKTLATDYQALVR